MKSKLAIGVTLALSSMMATAPALAEQQPPNIIVLITDDLNYDGYSYTGNQNIVTPHVDALIERGVFVEEAYATHHVSAPSRAALMTGRYQSRFTYETLTGNDQEATELRHGVDLSEIMLSQVLKDSGYSTAAFGKWHLGVNEEFQPYNRGFDYFYGFPGRNSYFDWGNLQENGVPVKGEGYITDSLGDKAVEFIQKNQDEPFFVYFAPFNVHGPFQVPHHYLPEGVTRWRAPKPRPGDDDTDVQIIYDAMIKAFDAQVGKITDTLEELGLDENTLIFLTNDNGGIPMRRNWHFRGGKALFYEGGLRMPFSMTWPARLEGGQRYTDGMISNMDIFPTAVAAAQGKMPEDREYDGKNLLPYITGEKKGSPHDVLYWRAIEGHAVRQGDLKLFWPMDKPRMRREFEKINGRPIGKTDLPLYERRDLYLDPELYNLAVDPWEQNNIADQHPELVETLKKQTLDFDTLKENDRIQGASKR